MSKIFSYIPSAYRVRKTYTAIPNLASADFDFTRAGTADRIDPNGNVETMTGNVPRIDYANGGCPELLLGGDKLGSELITNGSFDTDSDWTKGVNWSISDGKATHTGSTTNLTQNIGISGKNVVLTFDILSISDGVCNVYDISNGQTYASFNTVGTKTLSFQSAGDSIGFRSNSTNVSIDNVSVKETTPIIETCNGSQASFNDSEGVFQTKIRALSDDLSFRSLGVNDTTATNRILARYSTSSNSIELSIFSAGVPEAAISYEVEDITNEHFVECVWNGTYAELRVDGVMVGFTDTSNAPIGLSDCSFDTGVAGSEPFKGRCKEINVYDESTNIKTFASPTELMQFSNYEIIE